MGGKNTLRNVLRSWFFVESKIRDRKRRTKNQEPGTEDALCASFSLVEVTLAIMVVSVGILAVLSLFPMGLDQNARAIGDSHAALFADEVLNGLRACAETNWDVLDGGLSLPVAAGPAWTNAGSGDLNPTCDSLYWTNIYYVSNSIVDHAFRYRLALTTNGNIKAATLWVWSGQYGSTSAPSVFYGEFFRYHP